MKKLLVHTDGGARGNPGPAGIGVYITDAQRNPVEARYKYLGETTNNVAEYTGAYLGIKRAVELGADEIELFADSKLVIEQLSGNYKVKNESLKALHSQIRNLISEWG